MLALPSPWEPRNRGQTLGRARVPSPGPVPPNHCGFYARPSQSSLPKGLIVLLFSNDRFAWPIAKDTRTESKPSVTRNGESRFEKQMVLLPNKGEKMILHRLEWNQWRLATVGNIPTKLWGYELFSDKKRFLTFFFFLAIPAVCGSHWVKYFTAKHFNPPSNNATIEPSINCIL